MDLNLRIVPPSVCPLAPQIPGSERRGPNEIKRGESVGMNMNQHIASLGRMTVGRLQARYAEVFGESARPGNRQWLFRRGASMHAGQHPQPESSRLDCAEGDRPDRPYWPLGCPPSLGQDG